METPDPLEASNNREAVAVSQWRGSKAVAIGDNTKEEWLVAPEAVDLAEFR